MRSPYHFLQAYYQQQGCSMRVYFGYKRHPIYTYTLRSANIPSHYRNSFYQRILKTTFVVRGRNFWLKINNQRPIIKYTMSHYFNRIFSTGTVGLVSSAKRATFTNLKITGFYKYIKNVEEKPQKLKDCRSNQYLDEADNKCFDCDDSC